MRSRTGRRKPRRRRILDDSDARFGAVIAISYSAFDTFALPSDPDQAARVEATGSDFGYTYIGLRKPSPLASEPHELKAQDELVDEFEAGLRRALEKQRKHRLREALTTLLREPSFVSVGLLPEVLDQPASAVDAFRSLSTGHKIVLSVLVQLIGQLQPRSLVLFDEPESHLHPSLLAACLSALGDVLAGFDSVALVATHSPVVLQEIPARSVRILRRVGTSTIVDRLDIESFGENIGYLTRSVFHLDSSTTDFQRVLRQLAQQYTRDQIDQMFRQGLSQQGRAVLAAIVSESDQDAEA